MKPISELLSADPGLPLLKRMIESSPHVIELLPPGPSREHVLLELQVTTRSLLGTVAYETGGILVQGGWLRILGSGNERLERDLVSWNKTKSSGFFLIADDAIGGFFALSFGGIPVQPGNIGYLAPDTLDWEDLEVGYTDFLSCFFSSAIDDFYQDLRWEDWEVELQAGTGDQCISFYPMLWTAEGAPSTSDKRWVPVEESWGLVQDFKRQLG